MAAPGISAPRAPNLAITFLNAKAEPYVRPLAEGVQSPIFMPCDVTVPGHLRPFTNASRRLGPPRLRAALDRLCAQGGSGRTDHGLFG